MQRAHSFHENEKVELNRINQEQHTAEFRIRNARKNLMSNDTKTFYCDICYEDRDISSITIL